MPSISIGVLTPHPFMVDDERSADLIQATEDSWVATAKEYGVSVRWISSPSLVDGIHVMCDTERTVEESTDQRSVQETDYHLLVKLGCYLHIPNLFALVESRPPSGSGENYILRAEADTAPIRGFYDCDYMGYISHRPTGIEVDRETLVLCSHMTPEALDTYHISLNLGPVVPRRPKADNSWTLVTGYFDLTKEPDGNNSCRSFDHYIANCRGTLTLNQNLAIFCDSDSYEIFRSYREKYGLLDKTKFYLMKFEDFPLCKYRKRIIENRKRNPTADPRNTPSYYLFCMARCAMLKRVIEENPFGSTHFAWINICISRMGLRNVEHLNMALSQYRNKFSTLYIDYIPQSLTENLPVYFQWGRCSMCSGFYTGDREHMYRFCCLMEERFLIFLGAGYGHADEQLFSPIFFDYPDLFQFYYGDYQQMITNYSLVYENPEVTIRLLLPKSRQENNHKIAYDAARELLYCYDRGFFHLSPHMLCSLLDEYFISAWWCENGAHRSDCIMVVERFQQYSEDPLFLREVQGHCSHIIRNTDFIYLLNEVSQNRPKALLNLSGPLEGDNLTNISNLISQGYHVFVYGDYPVTLDSFILSNPVVRPPSLKFETSYQIEA